MAFAAEGEFAEFDDDPKDAEAQGGAAEAAAPPRKGETPRAPKSAEKRASASASCPEETGGRGPGRAWSALRAAAPGSPSGQIPLPGRRIQRPVVLITA